MASIISMGDAESALNVHTALLASHTIDLALARKAQGSAAIKAMAASPVMASPPTLTQGTSGAASTIASSSLKLPTAPEFRYATGTPVPTVPLVAGMYAPKAQWPNLTGAAVSRMPYFISFSIDCTQFEIRLRSKNAFFRMWVNGQLVSATATQVSTDFGNYYWLVDFTSVGGRAKRDILVEYIPSAALNDGLYFGGVTVEPTGQLASSTRQAQLRLAVVGDSYGEGSVGTYKSMGYIWRMGRLLGYDDVWSVAQGGTGVLADNGGVATPYLARLATDLYPLNPDVVVIQSSVNDYSKIGAGGLVRVAASDLIGHIKANLPNAKIIVTGLLFPGTLSAFPSSATALAVVESEMALAAADQGVTFIDTVTSPWASGTGKSGTTTGDGPADLYRGSDGIHPTQAGHDYLSERMAAALSQALGVASA